MTVQSWEHPNKRDSPHVTTSQVSPVPAHGERVLVQCHLGRFWNSGSNTLQSLVQWSVSMVTESDCLPACLAGCLSICLLIPGHPEQVNTNDLISQLVEKFQPNPHSSIAVHFSHSQWQAITVEDLLAVQYLSYGQIIENNKVFLCYFWMLRSKSYMPSCSLTSLVD